MQRKYIANTKIQKRMQKICIYENKYIPLHVFSRQAHRCKVLKGSPKDIQKS